MSKESGVRMTVGKFKGELIKSVPTWYLKSTIYKGDGGGWWLRSMIEKEINKRGGEYVGN